MLITGYHGTSIKSAKAIIKEKRFNFSSDNKAWLGSGIYFYPNIQDAFDWKKSKAILHVVINVRKDKILDIDTERGNQIYKKAYNFIKNRTSLDMDNKAQENQCAVMNLIWDTNPKFDVIMCLFPKSKTEMSTLHDVREKRKEFCIRNSKLIKKISLFRREELL